VCEKSKRREMEGVGYWRETRRSERGRDGAVEWGRREKKGRRCVRNREEEKERGVGCGRKERRKKRIEIKGEGETIERERERERNEGDRIRGEKDRVPGVILGLVERGKLRFIFILNAQTFINYIKTPII